MTTSQTTLDQHLIAEAWRIAGLSEETLLKNPALVQFVIKTIDLHPLHERWDMELADEIAEQGYEYHSRGR